MHYTHMPWNTSSSPGPGWPAVEPLLLFFWDAGLTDPMGGVGFTQMGQETFDSRRLR